MAQRMASERVAAMPAMISVSSVSRPAGPIGARTKVASPRSHSW